MATIRLHNAIITFASFLVFHQLEAVVTAAIEAAVEVVANVVTTTSVLLALVVVCEISAKQLQNTVLIKK